MANWKKANQEINTGKARYLTVIHYIIPEVKKLYHI